MTWVTIEYSLGQTGLYRDELTNKLNDVYDEGNWRFRWLNSESIINFIEACKLYEEAYLIDAIERRPELWDELRITAQEVYDNNLSNIDSGLDYLIQEADSAHIQDIAVRNVFNKLNWGFEGVELVQIRSNSAHEFARKLSPMNVLFHKPELIIQPSLQGWWNKYGVKDSVEEWYQTNKIFQVKTELKDVDFSPKEFLKRLRSQGV